MHQTKVEMEMQILVAAGADFLFSCAAKEKRLAVTWSTSYCAWSDGKIYCYNFDGLSAMV